MTRAAEPAGRLLVPGRQGAALRGTLAHHAAQGTEVMLICTTRGSAGNDTNPALGDLADVAALFPA